MVYAQVEGGEHNQRTWGFSLPYFLRWTFPTLAMCSSTFSTATVSCRCHSKGREVCIRAVRLVEMPRAQRAKHVSAASRGE